MGVVQVTHIVREENKEIIKEQLDFFVGEKFVVTFHRKPSNEVTQVRDRLFAQKNLDKWDTFMCFTKFWIRL